MLAAQRHDPDDRAARRRPSLLREELPELKVRFVNVNDLFALALPEQHPHGMTQKDFVELFTEDRPVIFNFHGYPSAIHQLIHRRPRQERFHVRGYAEEGTTTTPFDLLAMNGVDRYQLGDRGAQPGRRRRRRDVQGLSGEFAVRRSRAPRRAIQKFQGKLEEYRELHPRAGQRPARVHGLDLVPERRRPPS